MTGKMGGNPTLVSANRRECSRKQKLRTQASRVKAIDMPDPKTPDDFQEFNRMIGYPINRNTGKEQELAPYQLEYHEAIQRHHKVIVNKSRKIGITEAGIRSILWNCFRRYRGHDIMIVAGNRVDTAQEILLRFYELIMDKPRLGYAFKDSNGKEWKTSQLVRRSSIYSSHPIVELMNGTRIICYAASNQGKSQSFRGADDVICIFFSEAAHTGMLDDQPIMNALEPNLANRDDGDIILESTPNGRRGFFFNYWMDLKEGKMSSWHIEEWDYNEGLEVGILSQKYIDDQKANIRVDFDQEYCCKFTSSVHAIFRPEDINILPDDAKQPEDYAAIIKNYYKQKMQERDEEFDG